MPDPRTPSRRSVVRGVAWSVPVVSVAATAPAFAASPCQTRYTYRLDWGTTSYTRTDARNSSASVSTTGGGTPVPVTFKSVSSTSANVPDPTRNLSIPANTGSGTTADPVVTSLGGRANERGVMLYHATSTAGRANRQEVTITFGRAVRNLQFWITDVDTITSPAYADRVELIGYNASNVVVPFAAANDGITGAGSEASPWLRSADSNVSENAGGAQTSVSFGTADVKSLKLTYWNNSGGTQYHRVFLGDLAFTALGC
ncbi:hypothetical protein J2X46_001125 [Nocardioides sp. BE266]|uniref:hypothetical protein n=1 Tax=Nocardioides sp. BE266 TaxID=2817725 RepID=UPI00285D5AB1|nr:hypothetical protein [Nocardioides sp. BE266]MDR7252149.1 hypothetical protein [Nocardioides sp. BE266]